MIRFFPNMYQDELLYSALSRYYIKSCLCSYRECLNELFRTNNAVLSLEFPSHIEQLAMSIGNHNSNYIINKHTMFPLYYPFIDKQRQDILLNSMVGSYGKGIYMKVGAMASSLENIKHLKFCPECIKEDIETYGEAYWHRSHNLYGVVICYKHKVWLQQKCQICGEYIHKKSKNKFIPLLHQCVNEHRITDFHISVNNSYSNREIEMWEYISKSVNYILNSNDLIKDFNIKNMYQVYYYYFKQMGLLSNKGNVHIRELRELITNYYGYNILNYLKLDIDKDKRYSWIDNLIHKKNTAIHPLKHIILINFICNGRIEEFFKCLIHSNNENIKKLWPCLNPIANHYMQHVIEGYETNYDGKSKEIIGTFKCKCGFVYTRRLTGDDGSNIFKKTRIKEFGWLWENKLKETILSQGGSLRHIAKIMKADPMTVKKYASKLGLKPTWKEFEESVNKEFDKDNNDCGYDKSKIKDEYTNRLLDYLYKNQVSKTELRKEFKKEYIWLYRNDRELLKKLLNKCKKCIISKSNKKVDWNERDDIIYFLIKDDIEKILVSEKPIRITISRLGNDTGYISILEKHLSKLPRTKKLLEENIESVEQFQIRRVNKVINEMRLNGLDIKKWKIYRKAGLKANCSEKVKEEIKKILCLNNIREERENDLYICNNRDSNDYSSGNIYNCKNNKSNKE